MKWIRRSIFLALAVAVALASGYAWQQQMEAKDASAFPPPGYLIEVDGVEMHLNCKGTRSPTVVVETGIGGSSVSWEALQAVVAPESRVCVYDRVGLGHSNAGQVSRGSGEVARRLQELLAGAEIDDELILVGWSAGGLYARAFFERYPQRVVGMVLVDSSHEQQANRLPPGPGGNTALRVLAFLEPFGLLRASGIIESRFSAFNGTEDQRRRLIALYSRAGSVRAMLAESDAFDRDIDSNAPPVALGSLPLTVISRGKETSQAWNEMQSELASLSTESRHITAHESNHFVYSSEPELVHDAVLEMIGQVRHVR